MKVNLRTHSPFFSYITRQTWSFSNPIVKYPYSLQSCTLNVTLGSSGLKNYCTLCGFTGECNLDCHTCKTHARICSSQNYTQDAFSLLMSLLRPGVIKPHKTKPLLMTCTEVRLGLCDLRHSNCLWESHYCQTV